MGQNASFAGFTRLWQTGITVLLGGFMTFGLAQFTRFEDRLDRDEKAIASALASTTHGSDVMDAFVGRIGDRVERDEKSVAEYRLWADNRFNTLDAAMTIDRDAIARLDKQLNETSNRTRCLEKHTTCAP